jgi:N-acetylglucosaminyl-diphospho-decaprenol L-rhamnosyltransferase
MDVSVIIVEYFCLDKMSDAVKSISAYASAVSSEVIVISNSVYSSGKQKEIRTTFPQLEFIFNENNVGFGKAVNQGIEKAAGDFIMLLNPDGTFIDNSLKRAIEFMFANSQTAVIGPKIVEHSGELQDSCREFMTLGILFKRMMKRFFTKNSGGVLENKDYSLTQPVDWVSGACMLVRKEAINKSGMLDERYFMYAEDMDWCRNFKNKGWQVWYLPSWIVEHNAGRGSTSHFRITNKLMWVHMSSLFKYWIKWKMA